MCGIHVQRSEVKMSCEHGDRMEKWMVELVDRIALYVVD